LGGSDDGKREKAGDGLKSGQSKASDLETDAFSVSQIVLFERERVSQPCFALDGMASDDRRGTCLLHDA
jgi:hypothetical protein